MHPKSSFLKVASVAIIAGAFSACASKPAFTANYEGIQFASRQPGSISMAWRSGNEAWVVPAKNVIIQGANVNGAPLRMTVDGAYFKLVPAPLSFNLRIDGVDQPVVFSEKP
jgi:hypothetical protein